MTRIHSPKALLQFLESHGIGPKKGLSQNFLIDANILKKIVSTAEVEEGDVVLEIGPGPGALTEELLLTGATVVAMEKDAVLAQALHRLQTPDGRLTVLEGDAMEMDFASQLTPFLQEGKKAKVVANLPYQITTPILSKILHLEPLFSKVVVMIQEEVARRAASLPGSKEYGSLSVFLQFYSQVRYSFAVGRKCFYPAPNVDSAVICCDLQRGWPHCPPEELFAVSRPAFEQRRKMLRASLKKRFPADQLAAAFEKAHIDPTQRPEQLSVEDFVRLAQAIFDKEGES